MSSNQDIAYVAPKLLWERQQMEIKRQQEKIQKLKKN